MRWHRTASLVLLQSSIWKVACDKCTGKSATRGARHPGRQESLGVTASGLPSQGLPRTPVLTEGVSSALGTLVSPSRKKARCWFAGPTALLQPLGERGGRGECLAPAWSSATVSFSRGAGGCPNPCGRCSKMPPAWGASATDLVPPGSGAGSPTWGRVGDSGSAAGAAHARLSLCPCVLEGPGDQSGIFH